MQAIVDAYAIGRCFDEVVFLATSVSIAKRLTRAVAEAPEPLWHKYDPNASSTDMRVIPSPTLTAREQQTVQQAIADSPNGRQ